MASAFRILGEGQLSLTKFLLVTDRHVDLRNFKATLEHILARTHPETDLYVFSNLSMDTLDYTGPAVNQGSKGVWLGLGDPVRELPRQFTAATLPSGVTDVRVFCGGCLVVGRQPTPRSPMPRRLAAKPAFADWPLVVITDEPARAAASPMNFLWTTFTRFEPAADIHAAGAAHRAQSHRVPRADRHRRAIEAGVSEGAVVRRGDRANGLPPVEGVFSERAGGDGRFGEERTGGILGWASGWPQNREAGRAAPAPGVTIDAHVVANR